MPIVAGSSFAQVRRNLAEFLGVAGDATLLWPRWLVLRAVGLVYIFVFAGIWVEGNALVGPRGLAPAVPYLAQITKISGGMLEALWHAPSLFWINSSEGMVSALAVIGLVAAVALVMNLWPRMALFVCWLVFLSFVTTWAEFSPAQLDGLMLETALLCIPFAPRGLRPGLGEASPPRPIAVFVMRWLLIRVMLESGVVKLISEDPHWRNLTAMDVLYETSPSPTVLGYWASQLPHAFHVVEIGITFAAELLAPLLAALGGRRGRWVALLLWALLQIGIQLTCNFGWLNTAALGLGLLLLDDTMVATAAKFLRLRRFERLTVGKGEKSTWITLPSWSRYGLRFALGLHFAVTIYHFADACSAPMEAVPAAIAKPVQFFAELRSANGYSLYRNFESAHFQIDFEGSNDSGRTWRTYELRHMPQQPDLRPEFSAPWFPRFEVALQLESSRPGKRSMVVLTAAHLLMSNPAVLPLFARNPFPDRPPTIIRMRRYRLAFTDPETLRRTGRYWRKEYAGDYQPPMILTSEGKLEQLDLTAADAAASAGNGASASAEYERQYQLGNLDAGFRLAVMLVNGTNGRAQPEKAYALFSELAKRGELTALHTLGVCHEQGIGVPIDIARAVEFYRRAAQGGMVASMQALGLLSALDLRNPRDDVEGLAFLLRAAERAGGDDPVFRAIREDEPGHVRRLMARMSAVDIARARTRAAKEE